MGATDGIEVGLGIVGDIVGVVVGNKVVFSQLKEKKKSSHSNLQNKTSFLCYQYLLKVDFSLFVFWKKFLK